MKRSAIAGHYWSQGCSSACFHRSANWSSPTSPARSDVVSHISTVRENRVEPHPADRRKVRSREGPRGRRHSHVPCPRLTGTPTQSTMHRVTFLWVASVITSPSAHPPFRRGHPSARGIHRAEAFFGEQPHTHSVPGIGKQEDLVAFVELAEASGLFDLFGLFHPHPFPVLTLKSPIAPCSASSSV